MSPETTNTPAVASGDDGRQEQPTGQTPIESSNGPPQAVTGSGPITADAQQLTDAEQRATAEAARAEELQAALDAVNKALNPEGSTSADDPAQLAAAVADRDKQLDQVAAELRTAKVELAAHKAAAEHGARADRLLNSRSFLDSVNQLDPGSPKFKDQLGAAIRTAVEGDPDLYRAAPSGPARGGAEFNGPPAAERRPKTLHEAVAARLGA